MTYRLLAVDLDGTLLDNDARVPPEVRRALQRAQEAGLRVVVCTGRRYRSMRPILEDLGLLDLAVAQNGALVKNASTGCTVHVERMDQSLYHEILDAAHEPGFPAIVHVDGYNEGVDFVFERGSRGSPGHRGYVERNTPFHREVDDLRRFRHDDLIQVCFWDTADRLEQADRRIETRLGKRVTRYLIRNVRSYGAVLEIFRAPTSKWTGLLHAGKLLGIEPREMIAVGDDVNDIEMIRGAGLGYAVENARPQVLAAADRVAPANHRGGVAHVIHEALDS